MLFFRLLMNTAKMSCTKEALIYTPTDNYENALFKSKAQKAAQLLNANSSVNAF